jgi:hypothetical protein
VLFSLPRTPYSRIGEPASAGVPTSTTTTKNPASLGSRGGASTRLQPRLDPQAAGLAPQHFWHSWAVLQQAMQPSAHLAHLPQASPHDDPPQQSPVAAQPTIANAHDATAIRQNRLTVDIHLLMT